MALAELSPEQLDRIVSSDYQVELYFSNSHPYYSQVLIPYPRLNKIDISAAERIRGQIPSDGSGGLNDKQYEVLIATTRLNEDQTGLLYPSTDQLLQSLGRSPKGYHFTLGALMGRLSMIRTNCVYPFTALFIEELRENPIYTNMYLQELAVVVARGCLTEEIMDRYLPNLGEDDEGVIAGKFSPPSIIREPDSIPIEQTSAPYSLIDILKRAIINNPSVPISKEVRARILMCSPTDPREVDRVTRVCLRFCESLSESDQEKIDVAAKPKTQSRVVWRDPFEMKRESLKPL